MNPTNPTGCFTVAILLAAPLPARALAADRVETANDVVEGTTARGGVRIVRGIPFAGPPLEPSRPPRA